MSIFVEVVNHLTIRQWIKGSHSCMPFAVGTYDNEGTRGYSNQLFTSTSQR